MSDYDTHPLREFLGLADHEHGPLHLLGLEGGSRDRQEILRALKSRLAQVASHEHGTTPRASEVRLMLHAAAAQLLLPTSAMHASYAGNLPSREDRAALQAARDDAAMIDIAAAHSPEPVEDSDIGSVALPVDAPDAQQVEVIELLRADAMQTLAQCGGWNAAAQERVLRLAGMYGLDARHVHLLIAPIGGEENETGSRGDAQSPRVDFPREISTRRPRGSRAVHNGRGPDAALRGTPRDEPRLAIADASSDEQPEQDPLAKSLRVAGLSVVGIVFVIAIIFAGVVLMKGKSAKEGASARTGSTAAGSHSGQTSGATPSSKNARTDSGEQQSTRAAPRGAGENNASSQSANPAAQAATATSLSDAVNLLREASVQAEQAPDASLDRFERAAKLLAERWDQGDPALRSAGLDALLEFMYRTAKQPQLQAKAAAIVCEDSSLIEGQTSWSASQVRRCVWSSGVMMRLMGERDLSSGARATLQRHARVLTGDVSLAGEPTFLAGTVAALGLLPDRLTGGTQLGGVTSPVRPPTLEPGAWDAYVSCVTASVRDADTRQQLLLGAMERVLTSLFEPSQDQGVLMGLRTLTPALSFSPQSAARARVLSWFDRADISNADLRAITSSLVESKAAKGVDITMVLSDSATEADRLDLRARYESLWADAQIQGPRIASQKWAERARAELAALRAVPREDTLQRLALATNVATIRSAGEQLFRGDATLAAALETMQALGVTPSGPRVGVWDQLIAPSDGSWSARYLAAGADILKRRDAISQAVSVPTPVEAAVLVQEAMRGSPLTIRIEARTRITPHLAEPTVLQALLDFAPFMPITKENALLVEGAVGTGLPPARSPAWRVEVRRRLVSKLIEAIATDDATFIDSVAEHLKGTYSTSLNAAKGAAAAPSAPATAARVSRRDDVLSAARAYREELAATVRRTVVSPAGLPTLAQVEARLATLSQRSEGAVQEFVAEQTAAGELLATIVVIERPAARAAVLKALDASAAERASAPTVLDQVAAGEAHLCELWMLRLGGAL